MSSKEPRLVEIYRTISLSEAHGIKMALEEDGLQVFLNGDLLQGALGELPLGWATAIRISVEESQVQQAQDYIAQMETRHQSDGSCTDTATDECLACGQAMRETETTCSSCGWSYEPTAT